MIGATAQAVDGEVALLLRSWGEFIPEARLLITANRDVLWCNTATAKLVDQTGTFILRGSQFLPVDRNVSQMLDEFLGRMTSLGDEAIESVERADGNGYLIMCGHRVGQWTGIAAFGLRISVVCDKVKVRYADFSKVFSLTPAERGIVDEIASGYKASEIAERNGLSVGTVRTHVRSIYAKMDVTSREQLFFKLRTFRVL